MRESESWFQAIENPATEFSPALLHISTGKIPLGLRGTLYRNGPARIKRGKRVTGHWFDGDGAILAVHFTESGAIGTYRYVQTEGYRAEEREGTLLFEGYGTLAPGFALNRLTKGIKNVANTSVFAFPDRLLALWEGGQPYTLNLETLETYGVDDFGNTEDLKKLSGFDGSLPYSAHPKQDPKTKEIFNFGVAPGRNAKLYLYRSDPLGKILKASSFTLDGVPYIHDFFMAGKYLIFFVSPVRMKLLRFLSKSKSFSDSLTWQPEKGTQILVFDRETLALVSRGNTEPWYQWHFGNSYVDIDENIVVDLVRYEDFQTNQFYKEVVVGSTKTQSKGTLWRLHLNPRLAHVLDMYQLCDRCSEFPISNPQEAGEFSRYTYLSVHRLNESIDKELFGTIGRFDHLTGCLQEAGLGENSHAVEPIYVPDRSNPQDGWILTVVFNSELNCSEIWIFNADLIHEQPVCTLSLPHVIPFSFHGFWRAS
jgi:all-trans-8'-apo-beta-carotenal 15,15'-oxygenase